MNFNFPQIKSASEFDDFDPNLVCSDMPNCSREHSSSSVSSSSASSSSANDTSTNTTTANTNSSTTSSSQSFNPSVACSSSSSLSAEIDFLKQLLKRAQFQTIPKHRNSNVKNIRSNSSGFFHRSSMAASSMTKNNVELNPRAKTAFNSDLILPDFMITDRKSSTLFTPTTSMFSNNSIRFYL
ncbi:hypothetical protein SSS_02255, partial [Sarcoptes scabiei]